MNIPTAPTLAELDTLRREIERTCRAVAPKDLAGRPLYVVWASQLATETAGDHLYGCTIHSLDLISKPHIDVWEGRGPAFMLNDRAMFADAASCSQNPNVIRYFFEQTCWETAIHEWAHILQYGTERGKAPSPQMIEEVRLLFCSASEGTAEAEPPTLLDHVHGPEWIRIALHATWRADQHRGRAIGFEDVTNTLDRGLSSARQYLRALDNEPARMADRSFAEIVSTEPPAAFTDLWNKDAARIIAATQAA
jgi:hypothetical protein